MQNLAILDVFEISITQKLLKCPKDPFVRSALKCMQNNVFVFIYKEAVMLASWHTLFNRNF